MNELREYCYKWKSEIMWALATFVLAVMLEFLATDQTTINEWDLAEWGVWVKATVLAAARTVVVGFAKSLGTFLSK